MNINTKYLFWFIGILISTILYSCENTEVNQDEGPNFSEIHEEIQYNFDEVEINGIKYLILERDRNNPHEGFGFMALKGESNQRNQDTIKAYLKTMIDLQNQILSKINNEPIEGLDQISKDKFLQYLPLTKKVDKELPTATETKE